MVGFSKPVKILIIFVFLIIIFLTLYLSITAKKANAPTNNLPQSKLQVGNKVITVEIAKTQTETETGLSYRSSLAENSGMYFELGEKRQVIFWMKEMHFPLDIIWVDNGKIVGIEKNAPIPTSVNIPTFPSPSPVTNVLEVNAGFSDKNYLKIGDKVALIK